MFDLGIYVGPVIVLFGMLLALVGFLIWGAKAIKESVEEAQLTLVVDGPDAEAPIETESEDLTLTTLPIVPASELEKTAEFSQPLDLTPSFSQSFLEGQEFAASGYPADYNDAIDRIKADLTYPDEDAEASLVGSAVEDAHEDIYDDDNAVAFDHGADDFVVFGESDNLDDDVIEAAGVVKALNNAGQSVVSQSEKSDTETKETMNPQPADISPTFDTGTAEIDLGELAGVDEPVESMEETLVLNDLKPVAAAADKDSDNLLDSVALEETRMHTDIANALGAAPAAATAVNLAELEEISDESILIPEAPLPFGPKMAWLAIPGYKPSEVIALLRLADVKSANWTVGLTQAYADNNQVFVSPSLGGWVLVIGKTLWQKADMNRSAENIPWLKDIGRRFGNACFFSTMRGLGNHGWVGIRDGQIARAYGYNGESQEHIWLVGKPTEEEEFVNTAFVTEAQEKYQPGARLIIPDEKMVLAIAAAWSVDTSFRKRQYPPDFGFLGVMK